MYFLYSIILLCSVMSVAWAASFDCTKASTRPEKMICADARLSRLDEELGQAYRHASKTSDKAVLRTQQRRWIREKRDTCPDTACMVSAYQARIAELAPRKSSTSTGKYVLNDPGQYCQGSITLTEDDGYISATINTVCGPNYYSCDFEGRGKIVDDAVVLSALDEPSDRVTLVLKNETATILHNPQSSCGLNASMVGTYIQESGQQGQRVARPVSVEPSEESAVQDDKPKVSVPVKHSRERELVDSVRSSIWHGSVLSLDKTFSEYDFFKEVKWSATGRTVQIAANYDLDKMEKQVQEFAGESLRQIAPNVKRTSVFVRFTVGEDSFRLDMIQLVFYPHSSSREPKTHTLDIMEFSDYLKTMEQNGLPLMIVQDMGLASQTFY